MTVAAPALSSRQTAHLAFADDHHRLSDEVSMLLLRAATCVERDEANALDLMKRASSLLRPADPARQDRNAPATGGLAPWQAKRLDAFIIENMARSITIESLAKLCNLSASYFSAAFKASYGTSPHHHVILCRVAHAKALMLESDLPLCQVALDCGLADQAHLSRIFRRVTGTTPSAWRRQMRQASAERRRFDVRRPMSIDGMGADPFGA